jgi:Ca-activated chloride channel homolog
MLRCSLALILLVGTTLSSAQSPNDKDFSLSVDVELVQLPVSVLDKNGLPVRGLQKEHFTIYEDKIQQNISLFKQEDIPLSVALVVDASSSMSSKLDRLRTAAMTFVHESNPDDETAILSFNDDVVLDQDFTRKTSELNTALGEITTNGNTALYDAVLLGAKHLKEHGFHEKKVLLIVSDGEDNHSKYKLSEALEALKESKIIAYSVGLLGPDDGLVESGKKPMKEIADATGGASYFPKNVNDVESICKRIARELRNQYTIGYRPSNDKLDGSWRKVLVRINPPKGTPKVKVRTKQGYYAPVVRNAQRTPDRFSGADEAIRRQGQASQNADNVK